MIILVGDIHGDYFVLAEYAKKILENNSASDVKIIQVGDFGYWPDRIKRNWKKFPFPVYFIDGNHDHNRYLLDLSKDKKEPIEVAHNLFYIPRGIVLEMENWNIGFIGGANSVDRAWRTMNEHVFLEEEVSNENVDSLLNYEGNIDILISHSPPIEVISANWPPINKKYWKLPMDWVDLSAHQIQRLWDGLNRPQMYCGHMHRSVFYPRCKILHINEIFKLPEKGKSSE